VEVIRILHGAMDYEAILFPQDGGEDRPAFLAACGPDKPSFMPPPDWFRFKLGHSRALAGTQLRRIYFGCEGM
jgi:hypothetical protein